MNQKTLPAVHKQTFFSVKRDLILRATFYKLTITELDGIALQNYQAGNGFVKFSLRKIKIQIGFEAYKIMEPLGGDLCKRAFRIGKKFPSNFAQ